MLAWGVETTLSQGPAADAPLSLLGPAPAPSPVHRVHPLPQKDPSFLHHRLHTFQELTFQPHLQAGG